MAELFYFKDSMLYVHHTLDDHPQSFPIHLHEMYEIYYFISGDCSYLVEGSEYVLKPHDLLITRSAEAHKMIPHSDAPYERIVIHFHPLLISSIDPDALLLRPFTDRPLGVHNLYRALDGITPHWCAYFAQLDLKTDITAQKRLNIIRCLIDILSNLAFANTISESTLPQGSNIACRLINYVNDHLFEDISLHSVSDAFFLSSSQLNRIFRRASGYSCWSYIKVKRLLAARELLRQGQPAASVCEACGFHDYSAFYRAYRAQFGAAPSETHLSIDP